jgi:hypothetical protein
MRLTRNILPAAGFLGLLMLLTAHYLANDFVWKVIYTSR